MNKYMLLNNISNEGLKLFDDSFRLTEEYNNANVVLVRSGKMHEKKTDHLLCIARAGAGTNNIPVKRCADEGVVVFNTPGANANAVKELLLTGMLMAARDVLGGNKWLETLKDKDADVPTQVEKGKSRFAGSELFGKRVCVIGMGAIGSSLANTLFALGMKVSGYSPTFASGKRPKGLKVDIEAKHTVEEAACDTDYVVLSLPLKSDTRGMFNEALFSHMKKAAVLLNFSRAELIDEDALETALQSGKLRKYVTDFATKKVLHMDNVIALPHMGASTGEATDNCAIMAVNQIKDYVINGNIKNSVNYPDISLEKKSGVRLVVLYNSDEKYSEQIEKLLIDKGIEIIKLVSTSKNGYGAMLVDVESVSNDTVSDITKLKLVRKARLI